MRTRQEGYDVPARERGIHSQHPRVILAVHRPGSDTAVQDTAPAATATRLCCACSCSDVTLTIMDTAMGFGPNGLL